MAGTYSDLDDWTEAEEAEACALLDTMERQINKESVKFRCSLPIASHAMRASVGSIFSDKLTFSKNICVLFGLSSLVTPVCIDTQDDTEVTG